AVFAMKTSPNGRCRVISTGASGTTYNLPLTWVGGSNTCRCGPLNISHAMPSMDNLRYEISPNGEQWYSAPRQVMLFEKPKFTGVTPELAALHTPRWITILGVGFPRSLGLKISVEMPPGYARQALRVNSTSLRFRSPVSRIARNLSIFVSFGDSPSLDTGLTISLLEPPSILNITPPAMTVGDPDGADARRPVAIFGSNFRASDLCVFKSASMSTVRVVPLFEYIGPGQVKCKVPSAAASDVDMPPRLEAAVDNCIIYRSLKLQIEALQDQLNNIKLSRMMTEKGRFLPGCPGSFCQDNMTDQISSSLRNWFLSDQMPYNGSDFPGSSGPRIIPEFPNLSASNGSSQAGSSVEDNLALQMQTLIYQAATAMVECGAQSPEPLRAEPLGGFLLAAVWSPLLAGTVPATLGIEA
ncbi:unnamed protein product, partial [Polarella glacialis]